MPIPLFNEQRYDGMLFYGAPFMRKPLLGIRSPFLHPWSFSRRKRRPRSGRLPCAREAFPHRKRPLDPDAFPALAKLSPQEAPPSIRTPSLRSRSFPHRKRPLDPDAFPALAKLFPARSAPLDRLEHPFRRRDAFDARVDHRRFIERPPERFKHRFDHMVGIAPVMNDDMQVHPRLQRQLP